MPKLKAVIIDDEPHCRKALSGLLRLAGTVELCGEAGGVASGLELIAETQPDVVMLDIEMPDGSGFDLLEKIGDQHFDVVFTTAYEGYGVKAFRYYAADYLLKPIDPDELAEALSRVQRRHGQTQPEYPLDELLQYLRKPDYTRICLPTLGGFTMVDVSTIVRCQADTNYTNFFLQNGEKHIVARTLKEYEELLPDELFFRIHQSHLINLRFMKQYAKGAGGSVVLQDGTELPVSRMRKDALLRRVQG